jgi:hypothetical protein
MGEVWDLDLPFNKAWVLMALADHADHSGCNIYPSVGLVAYKTGYDVRSVRRIIADLRDDGILLPCGKTRGGVVIYRMDTANVPRKPAYEPEPVGRPVGRYDRTPRRRK